MPYVMIIKKLGKVCQQNDMVEVKFTAKKILVYYLYKSIPTNLVTN